MTGRRNGTCGLVSFQKVVSISNKLVTKFEKPSISNGSRIQNFKACLKGWIPLDALENGEKASVSKGFSVFQNILKSTGKCEKVGTNSNKLVTKKN